LAEACHLREHAAMKKFVIKILVNAVGLYVASLVVAGIELKGTSGIQKLWTILLVALIFGLVNTFIRPIVKLFSFGVLIVTLGLFTFVINALMLWLTSKISEHFAVQFSVKNFWSALLGSLIITAVSLILNAVLPDEKKNSGGRR
jgi:putative membrane protein